MESSWYRFDIALRALVPVGSCLILMLLTVVPWPWPELRTLFSTFSLMALCYWVVNRPDLFSMRWSFIIGFVHDVLLGQPIGLTALCYLGADFFLRSQRQFFLHQSFRHFWVMFAVVMLGVSFVQWGMTSLIIRQPLDILPIGMKVLMAVLLFPLMVFSLHAVQRLFLGRS
jgi:rod shape-determining protein MreD